MRVKEIDGLRAAAVIAVIVFHFAGVTFPGGFIGVELFFVISGYVITSALVRELAENDRLKLRNFYLRRFFRIVPPLAAVAIAVVLIDGTKHLADAAIALASMMNWYRALTPETGGLFSHAWSLSIEEQFYLFWPLALLALWHRGLAIPVLVSCVVGIMLWRGWLSQSAPPDRIYNGLDTHADGLLVGCAIALWKARLTGRLWVIPIAFLVAIFLTTRYDAQWMLFAGYSLVTLASAWLLLAALSPTNFVSAVLNYPAVQWVGLRSYSLYLWHVPINELLGEHLGRLPQVLAATALTFLAGYLSYRFIETPCARMGHRFGRSRIEPLPR